MPDQNPNLIPLPSIGESKSSRTASMPQPSRGGRSWIGIVVLLCVVVGIALGVYVYQQSIAPAPVPSIRPTPTPEDVVVPSPTPELPEINAVTLQSNTITFPKAGEIRVFFSTYSSRDPVIPNQLIRLSASNGSSDLVVPSSIPTGQRMADMLSKLVVTAGQQVTVEIFDHGNEATPGVGWVRPTADYKCGVNQSVVDAAPLVAWATTQAAGEPLVSIQCWGDYGETTDMNDYLLILTYAPPSLASMAPSASPTPSRSPVASPSPSPSRSPSPSPTLQPSPSPSPSPSLSTSPTPTPSTITYASVTPTPSPRVTMPDASTLPDAGVFEVTVGTMGVGIVLVLLGILGMLLI